MACFSVRLYNGSRFVDYPDVEAAMISELARNRGVDRDQLLTDLGQEGVVDSLEGLELALAAEQTFGISISDDELSSAVCRSIPSLVRLVQLKLSHAADTERSTR